MKSLLYSVFFWALVLPFPLAAQENEFGEIPEEDLQLSNFPAEPEADAVELFDIGEIKITPDFNLEMDIHRRIKILTEAGKEYANVTLRFWHEDKILDLKAASYSPSGEEHELDDDEIFEEEIKNTKKWVFTIPGVEVGSVIEYKYTLFSKYIHSLEPWFFQKDIYSKLSEISVYLPAGFSYSVMEKNLVFFDLTKNKESMRDPYDFDKKGTRHIWRVVNIPPIKDEPYMTAKKDYFAQVLFQLVAYKDHYNNITIAKKWDDVAERLWKLFDDYIEQDKGTADLAAKQINGLTSAEQKAKVLYDYVRSQIETASNQGIFSSDLKKPDEVVEEKSGSSVAKNLLLINLLNHAGIKAHPVLISTRSNGQLNTEWVQTQQFNRMITYIKTGNKEWFVNPGAETAPFGLLTSEYAVYQGLLLAEENSYMVRIRPLKSKNKVKVSTEARFKEDGSLTCKSVIEFTGLEAVKERRRIKEKEAQKHITDRLESIYAEVTVDTFRYTNTDSVDKPLILSLEYSVPAYWEEAGSLVLFEAPLLFKQKKNPFVREKRDFPVDFYNPVSRTEKVKISFPPSYTLSEKPQKSSSVIRFLRFMKIYFGKDTNVEVMRTFKLDKTSFQPAEYKKLKQVYEKMVQSDQEKIVLMKKS